MNSTSWTCYIRYRFQEFWWNTSFLSNWFDKNDNPSFSWQHLHFLKSASLFWCSFPHMMKKKMMKNRILIIINDCLDPLNNLFYSFFIFLRLFILYLNWASYKQSQFRNSALGKTRLHVWNADTFWVQTLELMKSLAFLLI